MTTLKHSDAAQIESIILALAESDRSGPASLLKSENIKSIAARFAHEAVEELSAAVEARVISFQREYPVSSYKTVADAQEARRQRIAASSKEDKKSLLPPSDVLKKLSARTRLDIANGGVVPTVTPGAATPGKRRETPQETKRRAMANLEEANRLAFEEFKKKK